MEYKKKCYMCRNPLDISVTFPMSDERFIRDIKSFETHRPIDFINNISIYKIRDGIAYRCCVACYYTPLKVDMRMIEIGKKPVRHPRSLTMSEIYDWFYRLCEYINRYDVDDCVVESVPTVWPLGLSGIMSHV